MRDEDGENDDGNDGDAPTIPQVMVLEGSILGWKHKGEEDEAGQSREGVQQFLIQNIYLKIAIH